LTFHGWELWQIVHPDNNFGLAVNTPAILDILLNISSNDDHEIKIEVSDIEIMGKLHYATSYTAHYAFYDTENPGALPNSLKSTISQFTPFIINILLPYFN